MTLKEVQTEAAWNSFVMNLERATFLHSWEWGQLQRRLGEEVRYLGFFDDHSQIGAALVITVKARRGYHYFVPHGPLFATEAEVRAGIPVLIEYLKRCAEKDKVVALRIASLLLSTDDTINALRQLGFYPAPLHVHAELTWELDISSSEEVLLQGMRKTTRHTIRKAIDHGVRADILTGRDSLARFMPLYEQTHQRHGFIPFSRQFLESQLEIFSRHDTIFTVISAHAEKDLAGAIVVHFGDTAYYYHGASATDASVPAAAYVQWAAIREAKRRGAVKYNFWGIAPDHEPHHPFAGITLFKKGFGGYAINYLHAQDLPLSLGYWKLWVVDSFRKWRRGF